MQDEDLVLIPIGREEEPIERREARREGNLENKKKTLVMFGTPIISCVRVNVHV